MNSSLAIAWFVRPAASPARTSRSRASACSCRAVLWEVGWVGVTAAGGDVATATSTRKRRPVVSSSSSSRRWPSWVAAWCARLRHRCRPRPPPRSRAGLPPPGRPLPSGRPSRSTPWRHPHTAPPSGRRPAGRALRAAGQGHRHALDGGALEGHEGFGSSRPASASSSCVAAQPVPAMVSDAGPPTGRQGAQPQHHQRGPEPSFVSGAADGEPVDGELVRRGGASRPELHLDERLRTSRIQASGAFSASTAARAPAAPRQRTGLRGSCQPPGLHEHRRRLDATGRLRERPSDHLLGLVQASDLMRQSPTLDSSSRRTGASTRTGVPPRSRSSPRRPPRPGGWPGRARAPG